MCKSPSPSVFPGVAAGTLCAIALAGCAVNPTCPPVTTPPSHAFRYEHAGWTELPGWSSDAVQEAWPAYLESCRDLRFRAGWSEVCAAAQGVGAAGGATGIRGYFQQYFEPYRLQKGTGTKAEATGIVTGYYEPVLRGARTA